MDETLSYKQCNNIIKSEQDSRLYRGLLLNNGMKVLLISDPKTDKSAAAMEVNVGMYISFIGLLHLIDFNLNIFTCKRTYV